MSKHLVINAVERERSGTSAVRRMRREGLVPGVVYGGESPNVNFPQFDSGNGDRWKI